MKLNNKILATLLVVALVPRVAVPLTLSDELDRILYTWCDTNRCINSKGQEFFMHIADGYHYIVAPEQ